MGKDLVPGDFRLTEGLRTLKWPFISVFNSGARGPPRRFGGILHTLYLARLCVCVCVCLCVSVFVGVTQDGEEN